MGARNAAAHPWTPLPVLGLYISGPGEKHPVLGKLYRPVLAAVFIDTISFAGVERTAGGAWVHQTWYCEIRRTAE
jgi:hypothetical protein